MPERAASSALGARLFYFITYGLYYISLLLYKNPLRDMIFFQREEFYVSDIFYLAYYVGMHGLAIYYFLTAGENPGFVEDSSIEIDGESSG